MIRIQFTNAAYREYQKLPREVSRAVDQTFAGIFGANPLSKTLNVKKLKVPFPGYRLRLGAYRILFVLAKDIVTVYSIKHRKDVYR